METNLKTEFINENRSFDSKGAIEAGHDARTAAIKEFVAWFSSVIKSIAYRGETQRI
ncbi:MAG: hypothetical protein JXR14_07725 [Paracoccaceae bacterium]